MTRMEAKGLAGVIAHLTGHKTEARQNNPLMTWYVAVWFGLNNELHTFTDLAGWDSAVALAFGAANPKTWPVHQTGEYMVEQEARQLATYIETLTGLTSSAYERYIHKWAVNVKYDAGSHSFYSVGAWDGAYARQDGAANPTTWRNKVYAQRALLSVGSPLRPISFSDYQARKDGHMPEMTVGEATSTPEKRLTNPEWHYSLYVKFNDGRAELQGQCARQDADDKWTWICSSQGIRLGDPGMRLPVSTERYDTADEAFRTMKALMYAFVTENSISVLGNCQYDGEIVTSDNIGRTRDSNGSLRCGKHPEWRDNLAAIEAGINGIHSEQFMLDDRRATLTARRRDQAGQWQQEVVRLRARGFPAHEIEGKSTLTPGLIDTVRRS